MMQPSEFIIVFLNLLSKCLPQVTLGHAVNFNDQERKF